MACRSLSMRNDGEIFVALYQTTLAFVTMSSSAQKQFEKRLTALKELTRKLPSIIPLAKETDRINEIFNKIPVPGPANNDPDITVSSVFNRRMDILFGEDVRDGNGRLKYILRGKFGMDMVTEYFSSSLATGALSLGTAMVKLERLVKELEVLCSANAPAVNSASKRPNSEAEDGDYCPPKRPRVSASPEAGPAFDENGDEILEDTELGESKEKRRLAAKKKGKSGGPAPKAKTHKKKASAKAAQKAAEPIEIESGEESDGTSAMKKVEEQERTQGARRGPSNDSMHHFHDPLPVQNQRGDLRWEFCCRYCKCARSFLRTVKGENITFDDERVLPRLNNLASHVSECSKKRVADEQSTAEGREKAIAELMNTRESAKMMEAYLCEGQLNPAIEPTQKGFLRIFSAWILDESLPWTTGEAPGLHALFRYLKLRYELPTDTTVRNQLAEIFANLHAKVVKIFSVSPSCLN
ncbi:hypothetical protein CPB84DRAFT_1461956 [Gymnopilus junonius]|uniref:Uncharacterized protein n=1 Tax=Gymnopilus junonius TaxID=109634 RepID=A0A9P5TJK5_GYMJU|nr:hypothetical protein CPB84DRAFT_1461956 [Gymnopilus junonius]